jgi:hypothetical protein
MQPSHPSGYSRRHRSCTGARGGVCGGGRSNGRSATKGTIRVDDLDRRRRDRRRRRATERLAPGPDRRGARMPDGRRFEQPWLVPRPVCHAPARSSAWAAPPTKIISGRHTSHRGTSSASVRMGAGGRAPRSRAGWVRKVLGRGGRRPGDGVGTAARSGRAGPVLRRRSSAGGIEPPGEIIKMYSYPRRKIGAEVRVRASRARCGARVHRVRLHPRAASGSL